LIVEQNHFSDPAKIFDLSAKSFFPMKMLIYFILFLSIINNHFHSSSYPNWTSGQRTELTMCNDPHYCYC